MRIGAASCVSLISLSTLYSLSLFFQLFILLDSPLFAGTCSLDGGKVPFTLLISILLRDD